jgi:hypothetical protein
VVLISLFNIHLTLDIHIWREFGANERLRERRAKADSSKWLRSFTKMLLDVHEDCRFSYENSISTSFIGSNYKFRVNSGMYFLINIHLMAAYTNGGTSYLVDCSMSAAGMKEILANH